MSDYRRNLTSSLVDEMLNERFDEIARKADAPFLGAGAYGGELTPTVNSFTLAASVQDGRIERGLTALEVEANRVEQYGFGAGELIARANGCSRVTTAPTRSETRPRADRTCRNT